MAQATSESFEVQIVTTRVENGIVLKLSVFEAQVLRRLVGSIYGKGKCRDACDDIYEALESENITYKQIPEITATCFQGE